METSVRTTIKQVKPILSLTHAEAHRRVIALYKTWYRQIPFILATYEVPRDRKECIAKLRELFMRNKDVTDIRVIDVLLVKGSLELQEISNLWKQSGTLMQYWDETHVKKPKDFMSKFYAGNND